MQQFDPDGEFDLSQIKGDAILDGHAATSLRLFSVETIEGDVATDKVAPKCVSGPHDDEAFHVFTHTRVSLLASGLPD